MQWHRNVIIAALAAGLAGMVALMGCTESKGTSPTASEAATEAFVPGHGGVWKALGLTDAQFERLQALRQKHRQEMQELCAGLSPDEARSARREAREAFRQTMQAELKTILTTEQMAKLEQLREERWARFGGKMHHSRRMTGEARAEFRARRMQHLTNVLDLTEEQQTQIQAAFMEVRPAQRNMPRGDRETFRAERRAQMDAKLREILTAEQYEKFLGNRAERGAGTRNGRSSD